MRSLCEVHAKHIQPWNLLSVFPLSSEQHPLLSHPGFPPPTQKFSRVMLYPSMLSQSKNLKRSTLPYCQPGIVLGWPTQCGRPVRQFWPTWFHDGPPRPGNQEIPRDGGNTRIRCHGDHRWVLGNWTIPPTFQRTHHRTREHPSHPGCRCRSFLLCVTRWKYRYIRNHPTKDCIWSPHQRLGQECGPEGRRRFLTGKRGSQSWMTVINPAIWNLILWILTQPIPKISTRWQTQNWTTVVLTWSIPWRSSYKNRLPWRDASHTLLD